LDIYRKLESRNGSKNTYAGDPLGGLPYISYMAMCRCEGYDFQAIRGAEIRYFLFRIERHLKENLAVCK